jgi:triosephosphate isomerase
MKPLIVANWKMNPSSWKEAKQLFNSLKRGLRNIKKAEVVVCPPFPYLSIITNKLSFIKLGAQDCFWQEKGAFTGEVSPLMLKDLGAKYVILGHSERRQIIGETDEQIAKKIVEVLKFNLRPILCVGESAKEREKGETFHILEREIREGLKKVPKSQIEKVVIAYEPIWAIGTGKPCSPDDALTATLFARKIISQIFSKKAARNIRVLYGGSVNSKNAKDYLKEEGINGLLVGGASLKPKEFLKIVKQT